MQVLVAYATRHGATRGIAEWIAETLRAEHLEVTLAGVGDPIDLGAYDAYVIGSAAYMGRWLKEAAAFVADHRAELAERPVWLFSSGPVGDARVDAKGNDVIEASRPLDFDELAESIRPRDEAVFFGAWDRDARPIGLVERLGAPFLHLPAIRKALPTGDFRDRPAVEAWATGIARELRSLEPVDALAAPA
jgi:menaquinone-dependent protoporphyrinogen oxidase